MSGSFASYGLSRRAAFSGAGLILAAATAGPAEAAERGPLETANLKHAQEFLKAWSAPDATGAKLVAFMADDGEFRFESKPPVVGKSALATAFDGYLADGKRYEMTVLETFAKGPVVVQTRHETAVTRGAMGKAETLVGIFVLRDGKIKSWENFTVEM